MKKRLLILGLILIVNSALKAQQKTFDEAVFLQNLKTSYFLLSNTQLNNFIASVSSAKMDAFTKANWDTVKFAPLQVIWRKPNDIFLTELKAPFSMNKEQKKNYREIVDALKVQVKGILLDLQRFYLNGLLDEALMNNYVLRHNDEAVQMTFKNFDQNGTVVKYLMGLNGLCIFIDIEYPLQEKQMVIYPEFKLVETKWLCQGWTVQTMIGGQVKSGFKLTIDYQKAQNIWLPVSFYLEVQKAEVKDKIFYDEIRFFNYRLNQNITITTKKK